MRIKVDRNEDVFVIEINYKNADYNFKTEIPAKYKGGELTFSINEDWIEYNVSPLILVSETENGYQLDYNIRLSNFLSFNIYKAIKSVLFGREFKTFKTYKSFDRKEVKSKRVNFTNKPTDEN